MTQFWYFHSGFMCDYFEGRRSLTFIALFIVAQLSWERHSLLVCGRDRVQHLGQSHSLNCCECRSLGQRQCVQWMCRLYWPYLLHVSSSQLLSMNCEQLLFSSSESSAMMCLSCNVYRHQGTARIFVLPGFLPGSKWLFPVSLISHLFLKLGHY